VPHAYKLQKEHGKQGLVVVLVESQGTSKKEEMVGFVMSSFSKYANVNEAFITYGESGAPFPSGIDGLPQCALVGVDGKLLLIGNNGNLGGKVDEAIEAELKKVQTGWGRSPEAKKIRSLLYGKKKLGEAAVAAAAAEGKVKEDAKADFDEAKAEVDARFVALKSAVTALMEAGRFADAKTAATDLQKSVKGKPEWDTEAASLVAEFAKPEVDKELKIEKSLVSIVKSIGDKKPTEDHEKKFKDLAKKNEGTKVGARAALLAQAVGLKESTLGTKKEEEKPKNEGGTKGN
jgi:hypothetical protein